MAAEASAPEARIAKTASPNNAFRKVSFLPF
jgi:hypothetical protein